MSAHWVKKKKKRAYYILNGFSLCYRFFPDTVKSINAVKSFKTIRIRSKDDSCSALTYHYFQGLIPIQDLPETKCLRDMNTYKLWKTLFNILLINTHSLKFLSIQKLKVIIVCWKIKICSSPDGDCKLSLMEITFNK